MRSRIRGALDLRPGEGPAVAWAAVMFFAVLCSYYILRPVRDAVVLDGNADQIPALFTATFVVMIVVAPVWGWLVARLPRSRFVPVVFRFFLIHHLCFFVAVRIHASPVWLGRVFYVWLSVFNLFVVSVFWSLCADVARVEQGRRLFGPIAAGGTAGALLGPLLTRALVHRIGIDGLLLTSAATLELAVYLAGRLDRATAGLGSAAQAVVHRPIGGSPFAGLREVARSRFLATIAMYAVCTACLATFVYLEQARIAKHALPDRDARTAFFAEVELYTGLATLCLQMFVTPRLMKWVGAGLLLAVLPLVQGAGVIALDTWATLGVVAAVSATGRAVTHGLNRPVRELLFTSVAREDKYKAKNVIDTMVYRAGDFASGWWHYALSHAGFVVASIAAPVAAVWATLALGIGAMFRRRTADERTPS